MRQITEIELKRLKKHLVKKPFTYEEVYFEVLDHYVSACEMSDKPCAEVIAELDQEFSNQQIERLNKAYIKSLNSQIFRAFKQSLISFFEPPKLAKTILIIGIFGAMSGIFVEYPIISKALLIVICLIPYVLSIYFGFKTNFKDPDYPGGFTNAHASRVSIITSSSALIYNVMIILAFMSPDFSIFNLGKFYITATLLIGLWMSAASVKVYQSKFQPLLSLRA